MNDRFKFRTFWKDEGRMYYFNGDFPRISKEDEEIVVIMQCTGLEDKNGTLIYEGDILKTANGVGIVFYFESTASYKLATLMPSGDYGFTRQSIHITDTWYYLEDWNLEEQYVIGNKFENPELLKITNLIN